MRNSRKRIDSNHAPRCGAFPALARSGAVAAAALIACAGCLLEADDPSASDSIEQAQAPSNPRVWVVTDYANYARGNAAGDPDDVAAMSMFLLTLDWVDVRGITVGSGSGSGSGCEGGNGYANAKDYFERVSLRAYGLDRPGLVANLGPGFESESYLRANSYQASSCNEKFAKNKQYDVSNRASVRELIKAASQGPLYVQVWGELTEVAIAVENMRRTNKTAALNNLSIVSHWTAQRQWDPSNPAGTSISPSNCKGDQAACDYLHDLAARGQIDFYELGFMGERGLVKTNPKLEPASLRLGNPNNFYKQSELADLFDDYPAYHNNKVWNGGVPDGSDIAAHLVVAGKAGGLSAVDADGKLVFREQADHARRMENYQVPFYRDVLRPRIAAIGSYSGGSNPCAGVSCESPPADSCLDATTRRTYASAGTCQADGSCSYSSQQIQCASDQVCQAGSCVAKPSGGGGGATMPGRIEAEHPDGGSDRNSTDTGSRCGSSSFGADTGSVTGASGGCAIVYAKPGETLLYDFTSPAGAFDLEFSLASVSTARKIRVSIDGQSVGTVSAPRDGYNKLRTRTLSNVSLSSGAHTLKVEFLSGGINFDYIDFK